MTHRLRLISVAVAAATAVALAGAAWSQPSDLRLGGWNTTLSMTLPGKAPSSSQLKTCVTKEDVESLRLFNPDENCKVMQVQRSPQRVSGKQVCRRPDGGTSEGEIDVRFDGPAAFTMTAVSRQSGKGVPAEVRMEMKARWAQASCKGFDD
jgi:hypothetical protein